MVFSKKMENNPKLRCNLWPPAICTALPRSITCRLIPPKRPLREVQARDRPRHGASFASRHAPCELQKASLNGHPLIEGGVDATVHAAHL